MSSTFFYANVLYLLLLLNGVIMRFFAIDPFIDSTFEWMMINNNDFWFICTDRRCSCSLFQFYFFYILKFSPTRCWNIYKFNSIDPSKLVQFVTTWYWSKTCKFVAFQCQPYQTYVSTPLFSRFHMFHCSIFFARLLIIIQIATSK